MTATPRAEEKKYTFGWNSVASSLNILRLAFNPLKN